MMLLSLKKLTQRKKKQKQSIRKIKETNKKQQNKQKQQQHITVSVYITGGDVIRQLL